MIVTQTMGAAPGRFPLQIERLWRCTGGSILDQLKQGFEGELGVAEQAVANQCAGCVAWIVRDLQEFFVPWRFSDAGRISLWLDRRPRRPKT
jgi:hypothetical protein